MATLLRSATKYLGTSAEVKPLPDATRGVKLDPGTEFEESDTGKVWRWDGYAWVAQAPELADPLLAEMQRQTALLTEMRDLILQVVHNSGA